MRNTMQAVVTAISVSLVNGVVFAADPTPVPARPQTGRVSRGEVSLDDPAPAAAQTPQVRPVVTPRPAVPGQPQQRPAFPTQQPARPVPGQPLTRPAAPTQPQAVRPAPAQTPAARPVPPPAATRPPVTQQPQSAQPQAAQPQVAQPAPQQVQPRPTAAAPKEQAVNLDALDGSFISSSKSDKPEKPRKQGAAGPAAYSGYGAPRTPSLLPNFKFYFDFWLINMPGMMDLTFKNIHNYIFVDLLPNSKLTFSFSFNLGSRSNFFELAYQATERLQIRFGKIFIPFDDMFPHSLYGGRPNLSEFLENPNQPFLPDLWAEPGIAIKYRMLEIPDFNLDTHAYVTNGFSATGTDPTGRGGAYPGFQGDTGISSADNNRDKAIGGRVEGLMFRKFGLGASYYTARWTDQALEEKRLAAIGLDSQLRFASTGTDFRAGIISMKINLPDSTTAKRGGWYAEAAQKLGPRRNLKAVLRTGYRQNDDRVILVSDQRIIAGLLLWRPGLIQWSFEHSRDTEEVPGKKNHTLTALRAALEF